MAICRACKAGQLRKYERQKSEFAAFLEFQHGFTLQLGEAETANYY
jgi:hypothetical protein